MSDETVLISPVETILVIDESREIVLLDAGVPGPAGADGVDGAGSAALSATADGPVGGHRAVVMQADESVRYPVLATATDGDLIVGVTTGSASDGGNITVQFAGRMEEGSWTWTPGPVFAGANGVLTQTAPSGTWLRQVGVAVAPTVLFIDLRPAILTP